MPLQGLHGGRKSTCLEQMPFAADCANDERKLLCSRYLFCVRMPRDTRTGQLLGGAAVATDDALWVAERQLQRVDVLLLGQRGVVPETCTADHQFDTSHLSRVRV